MLDSRRSDKGCQPYLLHRVLLEIGTNRMPMEALKSPAHMGDTSTLENIVNRVC